MIAPQELERVAPAPQEIQHAATLIKEVLAMLTRTNAENGVFRPSWAKEVRARLRLSVRLLEAR